MEPTLRGCPWGVGGLRVQAAGVLGQSRGWCDAGSAPPLAARPHAPLFADNSLPFPSFSGSAFNSPDLQSLAHQAPGPEEAASSSSS